MTPLPRAALDRWILRDPTEPPDECDECRELLGEEPFEFGNDYICRECLMRHVEEGEGIRDGER
jgi:hypothetical protein